MKELLAILSDGGWGVAAVFGAVIVVLWRDGKRTNERIFSMLDKHSEVLDKQTELMRAVQELRKGL